MQFKKLTPEDLKYSELAQAVVDMEEDRAAELAKEIVLEGMNIHHAIEYGLVRGMARVGELYESGEYFIPDLLVCSDVMNRALDILEKNLPREGRILKGRLVIGTIQGDTHDIGKNIVAMIIRSAGYGVLDLGRDVSPDYFIAQALEYHADIIAISTLLTTTMNSMGQVVRLLEERNLRNRFKVIIGGKPVSQAFAEAIGADYYAESAAEALRIVHTIMKSKRHKKELNINNREIQADKSKLKHDINKRESVKHV